MGCTPDTQFPPPEPSSTPKKEKDVDGKKEKDTDREKEKKGKGLDFTNCPNEGAKHPRIPAEKHREKHKERWGVLPALGGTAVGLRHQWGQDETNLCLLLARSVRLCLTMGADSTAGEPKGSTRAAFGES